MTTRDISTLLKLESYQDMTDEEINLIIDFWKEDKYKDGYFAGYNDGVSETENKKNEAMEIALNNALAAVQNANFMPQYISVEGRV